MSGLFRKLLVLSLFAISLFAVLPTVTHAQQIENNLCSGGDINLGDTQTKCESGPNSAAETQRSEKAINNVISQIINILSVVVGIVAVIMIIVGGFKYVTSNGDSAAVGAAKNTILYALIGLVIVALAQFIAKFVLGRAVGADTSVAP